MTTTNGDEAVEAAAQASYEVLAPVWRWVDLSENEKSMRRDRARAAVEAARPYLKLQLDREAVVRVISGASNSAESDTILGRKYVGNWADVFADAVMDLARPMPTREQVTRVVAENLTDPDHCGCSAQSVVIADAVLALINGTAK